MKFPVIFVLFVFKQEVFSQQVKSGNSTSTASSKNSCNHIITGFKDFTYAEYHQYLSDLLHKDPIPVDQTLDFPKTLTTSNYTLTDGAVARFYEPMSTYGSFDKTIFHQLQNEFFGITQVYGPKIDFSFKYKTNYQGSTKTGSLNLVVSHGPVELQIDLGDKEDGACTIDNSENDVFYFYDKKLTLIPTFDLSSDQDAGNDLVKQLADTWLGELYKMIMKVKVEKIATDTKKAILQDVEFRKDLDHICTSIK